YQAERTFGAEFMRHKRDAARTRRQEMAARVARTVEERTRAAAQQAAEEVVPWLRALGFGAGEARRAAARCETVADASLEQRVRLALTCFGPRTLVRVAPARVGYGP